MPLTVLSVAYPFAPVGPDTVGGAEQILSALDRALVRAGHCSVVVAHAASHVQGTLLPTDVPPGLITEAVRAEARRNHQAGIDRALATEHIDVVHMHGIDFHDYRMPTNVPVLVTLHLPLSWYPQSIWQNRAVPLQCVSCAQREGCPPAFRDLPVIPNGVPIYPASRPHRRRRFALALGRVCPEKNLHVALDAGTLAGIPVLIGGQVYPYAAHQHYFETEIAPRLSHTRNAVGHRFLGPLRAERKRRLLRAAQCLLLPTLAPETSSLVAMEALAAGTPVIAFPSGAIPEIVREGVTGFLVQSAEEMARAMNHAAEIDAAECQHDAAERFSEERMIDGYFELYRALLDAKTRAFGTRSEARSCLHA